MQALPEIAKNVAEPLSKVDKITMYGDGNGTKLISDIVNSTTQVSEGLTSSLGIDLKTLLAGFLGGKVATSGGSSGDGSPVVIVTERPAEENPETPDAEDSTKAGTEY